MTRHSAGLVVYRRRGDPGGGGAVTEVLLCHPGGPYWTRRDEGWWSIPKGEVEPGEDPLAAATREFTEELGLPVPAGAPVALGEVVQGGGKRVVAWAVEGDVDVTAVSPGTFTLEWPPRSGATRSFPEVDRVGWFGPDEARRKLLLAQLPLLDRLDALVTGTGAPPGPRGIP